MSGIVTATGEQFERCNQCGGWEYYQHLRYAPLNPKLPIPEWAAITPKATQIYIDLCRQCEAGAPWQGEYRIEILPP